MNIIGPDRLVFAPTDATAAAKFIADYGLVPVSAEAGITRFAALDGTSIDLVAADDPTNPDTLHTGNQLRRIVYGTADMAALDAVAAELSRDHEITRRPDGSFDMIDPLGFALTFQVTCRKQLDLPPEAVNISGAVPQRPVNQVALAEGFVPQPRSLSHFALFVPDLEAMETFYIGRLGFRLSDRLGGGPFLRAGGTMEHHTMFLIKTPPFKKGIEHLTFHMGGAGEVVRSGNRLIDMGYPQFWGPGRHQMGGNWFWYFNSPLDCNFEYDADMDLHDENWVPRELPFHPDNAQAFLFERRATFVPGAPPPGGAAH